MSTHDLRGRYARVDKRDLDPKSLGLRVSAHGWWLAPLLLAPFLPGFRLDEGGHDPVLVLEDSTRTVGTELPLHVNARVEKWLERFQTSGRAEFARILERTGIYDELIRGELRRRGMPEELVYLAMMESGLSPWAVSQVSAVGMWQFMSPTAIEYGLRVDAHVDERKDHVRATKAPLDYLEWVVSNLTDKPDIVERARKQLDARLDSQEAEAGDDAQDAGPSMADCARSITMAKRYSELEEIWSIVPEEHRKGLAKFYETRKRELSRADEETR